MLSYAGAGLETGGFKRDGSEPEDPPRFPPDSGLRRDDRLSQALSDTVSYLFIHIRREPVFAFLVIHERKRLFGLLGEFIVDF